MTEFDELFYYLCKKKKTSNKKEEKNNGRIKPINTKDNRKTDK